MFMLRVVLYRSGLFQTISSLYALLLIVVGLVLSIAEVSKPQPVLLFDVFEVCIDIYEQSTGHVQTCMHTRTHTHTTCGLIYLFSVITIK